MQVAAPLWHDLAMRSCMRCDDLVKPFDFEFLMVGLNELKTFATDDERFLGLET